MRKYLHILLLEIFFGGCVTVAGVVEVDVELDLDWNKTEIT